MMVKISRTVLGYLEGGSLFQAPDALDEHGYGKLGQSLVAKVRAARTYKDGSVKVDLSDAGAELLEELAGYMADSARDDAGIDPYLRGELNAAVALQRQIHRGREAMAS